LFRVKKWSIFDSFARRLKAVFANVHVFSWRLIVRFFCVVLFVGVVLFGLVYRAIRSTLYRCSYSLEWCTKIEKSHSWLIGQHGARTVSFKSSDGINLSGLLITRPQAKCVVVLCHGFWMSKEHMRHFIELFPDQTLLLFDFRAHGSSDGDVISIGYHEKKDVQAAVSFLHSEDGTKNLPIVGFGISMGAATVLAAAADGIQFKALILDSSFADLDEQVGHVFSSDTGLPATLFMPITRFMYEHIAQFTLSAVSPVRFMQKVTCPILIIHSEDDHYIPVCNARQLYDQAKNQKELWLVKKSKHGYASVDYPDEYAQHTRAFLNRYA
jgi:pimeloyl-ACP methyl ester carboxylesterase